MLARALRVLVLAEFGLLLLLAHWLSAHRGWPTLLAISTVVGLALGWRFAAVAASFLLAWTFGSPSPSLLRPGFGARARAVLRETWVASLLYTLYQLFPARFGREGKYVDESTAPAVLLVHGYLCNAGVWRWYAEWLEQEGFRVHTVSLEPLFGSVDANSRRLEARINELNLGSGGLILICHSMGGLVAWDYLRRRGPGAIRSIVTLGSPYQGSLLAKAGFGENARQMRPGSAWLKSAANLSAAQTPRDGAHAILTHDDNIVFPQLNATLPDLDTITFTGLGHLGLLASREVFSATLARLPKGRRD